MRRTLKRLFSYASITIAVGFGFVSWYGSKLEISDAYFNPPIQALSENMVTNTYLNVELRGAFGQVIRKKVETNFMFVKGNAKKIP